MEKIEQHKDKYAGHVCFIRTIKTISTAEEALSEYSTRDYMRRILMK